VKALSGNEKCSTL